MPAELQFIENPTIVIVPPPNRGGRYRLEIHSRTDNRACGHQSPQALLWLIFLEAGQEAAREVTDAVCSQCDPARFARLQAWAEALR